GPAEVLEAVHIAPHAKFGINELDNGLLMRGDLHSLFDANLLRINPDELTVEIDDTLSETPYWKLNGKTILPRVDGNQISTKYLKERWDSQKDA
ncbi:MAG: HNH endonuclease, partial [Desulfobacterales bacterium]